MHSAPRDSNYLNDAMYHLINLEYQLNAFSI